VVSELVTKILSLEDIPEDDAHSLSGLLSKFCDQVERDVITPVSLVHELPLAKLVPSWARLHETRLLCVLVFLVLENMSPHCRHCVAVQCPSCMFLTFILIFLAENWHTNYAYFCPGLQSCQLFSEPFGFCYCSPYRTDQ